MADAYISDQTLDDVMRSVVEQILAGGEQINPSKGPALELDGVLLEITDPRARLSRTETRGKPYSCLGYLCWYLAQSDDLDFISYYLPRYKEFADGEEIFGAYGPRLFNWDGLNQVANVVEMLKRKPHSRQAVIQLFDARDTLEGHKNVPCTCTLQFMLRRGALHMLTYMRSNDVFLGLPHDVFCFTMLQEIMARTLSVEPGPYKHAVGSLHLYESAKDAAQQFLDEGWQTTVLPMQPMPLGDPWPSIALLLKAESSIRTTGACDRQLLASLDPYWGDLVRLLQVFGLFKRDGNAEEIKAIRGEMASKIFLPLIDKLVRQLDDANRPI